MRVILNVPDIQIRPSRRSPSSDHVHAPESVSSGDHAAAAVVWRQLLPGQIKPAHARHGGLQ